MPAKIPAHIREQQINDLPNISFVRWGGMYHGKNTKAVCRCDTDGFEWAATVHSLVNNGSGCPHCVGNRRQAPDDRIGQINAMPNISFVRWDGIYKNNTSKAICRCAIDGHEWSASVHNLVNGGWGCPQCGAATRADKRRTPSDERIAKINAKPNISFVRWDGIYKNNTSKAICRCAIDGFEWPASVNTLISSGSGCPQCASHGFNPSKQGTLYILRSDCGSMVKIGISNDHEQRHGQLKRNTPFDWHCIELLHSADGSLIAELEKELHSFTEPATFRETFDGYTEWRKWDDRLPMWIKRYRARLERYNKAP